LTVKTLGYLTFLFLAIYIFLRYLIPYVLPFVLGVFIAFLLEPVVDFVCRRTKIARAWAAFATILVLVVSMGVLMSSGITRIAEELTDLYGYLPQYYGEFTRIMSEMLRIAGEVSQQLPEPLARVVQDQWNRLYSVLSAIVTGAGGIVKSLPGFTVTLIFTILSAYFVIKDRATIGSFIQSIVPARVFENFKNVEFDILNGIAGFIRVQIMLVFLTMIANIVGLTLLKSRYAVAVGVLLAILDILPLIGPGLIYLPWITYHLFWGDAGVGIGLILLYAGVSFFRQAVQTHLVGKELGLHPLVALVSLYVGFRLFGAPGLIYGPLVAILIKGLWVLGLIPHEGGARS